MDSNTKYSVSKLTLNNDTIHRTPVLTGVTTYTTIIGTVKILETIVRMRIMNNNVDDPISVLKRSSLRGLFYKIQKNIREKDLFERNTNQSPLNLGRRSGKEVDG